MKSSTASKKGKQSIAERKASVRRQRLLVGFVAVAALLYIAVGVWFLFHFEPKSSINGIDVSGMTLAEAETVLKSAASSYVLTVSGPDGQSASITGPELEMAVTDASDAERCLRGQPVLSWLVAIFRDKQYDAELKASYNSDTLAVWMDGLPMLDESAMETPVDAYLEQAESGVYVIVPEIMGSLLRTEEARGLISEAVSTVKAEADLAQAQTFPEVYRNDPVLLTRQEEWNGYLQSSGLTYNIADTREVLDGPVIAGLLEDDGEHVTLSREKVVTMMAVWRDRHDTYKTSFPFRTHDGDTVYIEPYGDYGFELNEEATCEDVM
ncbi:MAG: hypothetical protein BZ136_09155, partial [Methanosphaera sp. rholeuAM74]